MAKRYKSGKGWREARDKLCRTCPECEADYAFFTTDTPSNAFNSSWASVCKESDCEGCNRWDTWEDRHEGDGFEEGEKNFSLIVGWGKKWTNELKKS